MAKVSQKQLMDNVKNIGWDKISFTQKTGYKGAVQQYDSTSDKALGGKVAVIFGFHDAYIVEDEEGLYGVADLYEGIIKPSNFDVSDPASIDGSEVLAWEEDGEIQFNEEVLETLGLNDFSVKESIRQRLYHIAQLDVLVDFPL